MNWLIDRLQSYGSQTACIESGKSWTYSEFVELVKEFRSELSDGRSVLPVQTDSTIEGLAQLLAITESNHIALPLPQDLPEVEQTYMREVTASSPLYSKLSGSGIILFSSGTSGKPKAMLHSLPALLNRFKSVTPRNDRTLQLLLIDHIGGLDAAFRCLCAGSTLIIPEARTADAAGRAIEAHGVNVLPASPTFLNLMLMNSVNERYDCSTIEIIAYGAETMPQTLLKRLRLAFPKARLQQKFGTSETGAIKIESRDDESIYFRIKDTDTEWKVVDKELWLKTPSRILGYLNADESSLEADGWYRTGDLVEEKDEFIKIIGRIEEVINVGGEKTTPSEIENILLEIPEVMECVVYGEENAITGQTVAAKIVTGRQVDTTDLKRRIKKYCRSKLSAYKVPTRITFCDRASFSSRYKKIRRYES